MWFLRVFLSGKNVWDENQDVFDKNVKFYLKFTNLNVILTKSDFPNRLCDLPGNTIY